ATDEGVARTFLERARGNGRRLVVAQVIDSTQLALGLRLTRELMSAGFDTVVIASQRDVLESQGRSLDTQRLAEPLGLPAVHASPGDASGRAQVLEAIDARVRSEEARPTRDFDPAELARRVVGESPRAGEVERRRRTLTARIDAVLLHPLFGPL